MKLTDGALATGSWNDGTNVGFRNDTDNGNPQPRIVFNLGSAFNVTTIDIWTVSAFLGNDESVSISSSTDNLSFSTPVVVNFITWIGGFGNTSLRKGSIDVSSLPSGQYYRVDVLVPSQWMMINEIQLDDGTAAGPDTTPPTLASYAIVDDQSGGPVNQISPVTYTVTFNEDMDYTTVDASDFGNAGSSNLSIGTITEASPGVFSVEVTPTGAGTLRLEIVPGAVLTDSSANPLDTSSAITDDTTITVTSGNIAVTSYVYGTNAESQPQPTSFQNGTISDVGNVKLTDGVFATGSWNDGTNVGFRDDADNGAPQPQVTLYLGALYDVETIDIWTVSAFLGNDESVSISSSVDGSSYGPPMVVNPLVWTGGFSNAELRRATVDVSSLPDGWYFRLEFLDPGQWMMINEVEFTAIAVPTNDVHSWIGGFGLDPADQDFGDDPDYDGLENGLEAWFGTHPGQFNAGLADLLSDDTSTTFTFTHPQDPSPPTDVSGFYQWSPNLTDWYLSGTGPGGAPIVTLVPDTVAGTTTVTATATASEPLERLFLRVGATQN